jgi:hypothetical protein
VIALNVSVGASHFRLQTKVADVRRCAPPKCAAITTNRASSFAATAPAAPSFRAVAVSGLQVDLSWKTVPGASGYVVDVWINSAWLQFGILGSSTAGCSAIGLNPL